MNKYLIALTVIVLSACSQTPQKIEIIDIKEKQTPFVFSQYQGDNAELTQQRIDRHSDHVEIVTSNEYVYWVTPTSAPTQIQTNQAPLEQVVEVVQAEPILSIPEGLEETPAAPKNVCRDILIDGLVSGVLQVGLDNQPVEPRLAKLYRCNDTQCMPWFEAEELPLNCNDSAYFMHPDCRGKGDIACEYHPEIFVCNPGLSCEEAQ